MPPLHSSSCVTIPIRCLLPNACRPPAGRLPAACHPPYCPLPWPLPARRLSSCHLRLSSLCSRICLSFVHDQHQRPAPTPSASALIVLLLPLSQCGCICLLIVLLLFTFPLVVPSPPLVAHHRLFPPQWAPACSRPATSHPPLIVLSRPRGTFIFGGTKLATVA